MPAAAILPEEESPDILSFQRENHQYRIGETIVPSVTKVLRMAGFVRFRCKREVLEKASRRGKLAHMITADIDHGVEEYWRSDEEQRGYAEAWKEFKRVADFEPDQIERQVSSKLYRFAGTFDRTGWLNSRSSRRRYALLEIKTGVYSEWHGEQLGGYSLCLDKNLKAGRVAVYLQPDGKFHIEHFESPLVVSNFVAALCVGRIRAERKLYQDDEDFNQALDIIEPYTGADRGAAPGSGFTLPPGW